MRDVLKRSERHFYTASRIFMEQTYFDMPKVTRGILHMRMRSFQRRTASNQQSLIPAAVMRNCLKVTSAGKECWHKSQTKCSLLFGLVKCLI